MYIEYIDWHIPVELIQNRSGKWYFGVVNLVPKPPASVNNGSCADLTTSHLLTDFNGTAYSIGIYVSGCYYYNTSTDTWEGIGIQVAYSLLALPFCLHLNFMSLCRHFYFCTHRFEYHSFFTLSV